MTNPVFRADDGGSGRSRAAQSLAVDVAATSTLSVRARLAHHTAAAAAAQPTESEILAYPRVRTAGRIRRGARERVRAPARLTGLMG